MKQGRKVLCFVLTMILALSTVLGSVTVSAAKTAKVKVGSKIVSGSYQYQVLTLKGKKGTAALIGTKSKKVQKVEIPEAVKSGKYTFTVVEIGNSAFKNCKNLQSVETNKALQVIGKNAFRGCTKLETIVVNSSKLKKVGTNALKGTKKVTLLVPNGKESAYAKVFNGKGQKNTLLPMLNEPPKVSEPSEATPEKDTMAENVPAAAAMPQTEAEVQKTPIMTAPQTEAEVQQTPIMTAPQTEAQSQKALETSAPQTDVKAQNSAGSEPETNQAMEKKTPDTAADESETMQQETAHEHKFPETWTQTVEPTCITMGEEIRICEDETCGETETRKIPADPTDPSKHKMIQPEKITIEPTCTTWGKDKYWQCEICGQEFFDLAGMKPLGHDFPEGEYTTDKEATCTTPGVESIHCKRLGCHATTGAREIEAKGHTWGEPMVTPATCTTPGYTKQICTVCGAEETIAKLDPTGHQQKEEVVKPATCTENGESKTVCKICGEELEKKTLFATGHHTLEETKTEHPSDLCYKKGTVTQHCSACGQNIVVGELGYGAHHYDGNVCKECGLSKDGKYDFSGYIWFATYKVNLAECVGFNGNGTGDSKTKTVRGDVPICVSAPAATSGYHFAGWKITTANGETKEFKTESPNRVDTYEKVLRELGILSDVGPRQCPNQITIEAIYEADLAA